MRSKIAFIAGALLLVASVPVNAQTQPARDAVKGDPVAKPAPSTNTSHAATIARSDKQAPGTENGNQPDRASAGGGAH